MSKGAVFLDLPGLDGQRIGTYLMNEIVQCVQQWPEATVNGIELLAGQAHGDNKARRNWFYEQFGLVFDYTDPEHREGRSRPMLAGALVKVETWKQNITEHRMLDYLAAVLYAEERATSELQCVFHPNTTTHSGPNPASDSGRNPPPAPLETLPPVPIQSRPPIPKQTRHAGGLM